MWLLAAKASTSSSQVLDTHAPHEAEHERPGEQAVEEECVDMHDLGAQSVLVLDEEAYTANAEIANCQDGGDYEESFESDPSSGSAHNALNSISMTFSSPQHSAGRSKDAGQVPASPSSIVDGLQRHIKDLMRCIEIRDAQHKRMISGMQEQKAKLELLMQQQAEAAMRSFEAAQRPFVLEKPLEKQQTENVLDEKDDDIAGLSFEIDKLQKLVEAERCAHKNALQQNKEHMAQIEMLRAGKTERERASGLLMEKIIVLENDLREQQELLRVSTQEYENVSSFVQDRVEECERLEDVMVKLQTGRCVFSSSGG